MEMNEMKRVATLLRPVPDFPKPGILFWDIEPVLRDFEAMNAIMNAFDDYWMLRTVDAVAGFDARGFIFGSLLAAKWNLPFVQIRKKGKLPGKVVTQAYSLEYGEAEIEMIDDGFIAGKRVLLVDDLLATGGTGAAGALLIERLKGIVVGFACVTEIPILGGRGKLMHYPVQSLISVIENTLVTDVEYCVDMLTFDHNSDRKGPILVKRLSEPLGNAMPGGRIDDGESVYAAAKRELVEETGCKAKRISYLETLASLGRDPRGVKVSIVVNVEADTSSLRGEPGKTIPFEADMKNWPPMETFVFGHGEFLSRI